MVKHFFNKKEAEMFQQMTLDKGGTAEIRKPSNDEYYEVVWTQDKNRDRRAICFGYPGNLDILQELERQEGESEREFNNRANEAYDDAMHRYERPDSSKRVYLETL